MSGLLIEIHASVARIDQLVVAAAFEMKMPRGLDLAGRFVVGNLVGADDVIAIIDLHVAGKRPHVAPLSLLAGDDLHWGTLLDRRHHLGDWNRILLRGLDGRSGARRSSLLAFRTEGKLVGQRLRRNPLVKEATERDTPKEAGRHSHQSNCTITKVRHCSVQLSLGRNRLAAGRVLCRCSGATSG